MDILIVDDDEIARMSLANILGGLGPVVQAEDGEAAWELLDKGLRPDVCCCDVMMPRLDGLGLLQRARAHPVLRDLPFVLISSAADRATVETAIAGGIAGYILKPFLAVQTRTTVERVGRERQAADAEPVLATARRLSVDPVQLRRLLEKLRDDATGLAATPAEAVAKATDTLGRLRSGALVLGLWRCAGQLERVPLGTAADALAVVREVARVAGRQLAGLPQPAAAGA